MRPNVGRCRSNVGALTSFVMMSAQLWEPASFTTLRMRLATNCCRQRYLSSTWRCLPSPRRWEKLIAELLSECITRLALMPSWSKMERMKQPRIAPWQSV
eukprot:15459978-Alexandrium_andersonii.AAC.1